MLNRSSSDRPVIQRLRVYRTFFLGLVIGLFYAAIISDKSVELNIPDWLNLFEQRVLVLTVSGILGGVIYTIMVDGTVELPRFSNKEGSRFEAGLLGDMLLGIAGAFVLDFLTSPFGMSEDVRETVREQTSYVVYGAKGIIGGYASETIMDLALNRFLERSEQVEERIHEAEVQHQELEEERSHLQTETQDLRDDQHLLDLVNLYIDQDLLPEEQTLLFRHLQEASPALRQQIFDLTQQLRSTASRSEEFRGSVQRTIPIFQTLIQTGVHDSDYYAYHAQLAYAYKDAESLPTVSYLRQALEHLNEAIALRPSQEASTRWKYELNRAIVQIELTRVETGTFTSSPDAREDILADLMTVQTVQDVSQILQSAQIHDIPTPILDWITHHQSWLQNREDGQTLLHILHQVQSQ